jgi:4-hydroxy-2-oxoheptanedioate aldolase
MRPNPLRDKFATGEVILGGWLSLPSTASAEVMGGTGFDYVNVDMQHGLIDYSDVVPMLQAIAIGSSTPLVRVPWKEPGIIGKALDAGAMGVIVPMVNTAEECEAAQRAGRYAPAGARSVGPVRALVAQGAEYLDRANESVSIIPMIETVEAVANLDEILSVAGVEAIYVGPADLAVSLGLKPGSTDDRFHEALATIVSACERHGVVPGIHATADLLADRTERGFRMVTVCADFAALRRGIASDFATASDTAAEIGDSLY